MIQNTSVQLKTTNPKVSVIIPCYNGAQFIREAIESVLSQTYQHLELIVVDDGSTDNSLGVIKQYLSDSRVKVLTHEQNEGIPAARNTGIRSSKGQYIAFLDQDDLWKPKKIEAQVKLFNSLNDPELGIIFTNLMYIDCKGKAIGTWKENNSLNLIYERDKIEIIVELFRGNIIPTVTAMIRKECFDKVGLLNENLHGADDYEFWLRAAGTFKMEYINDPLVKKRIHKDSAYTKQKKDGIKYKDLIMISHEAIKRYPFLFKIGYKKLALLHYAYGRWFLNNGYLAKAKREFSQSLKYRPFYWKAHISYLLTSLGKFGYILNYTFRKALHRVINES